MKVVKAQLIVEVLIFMVMGAPCQGAGFQRETNPPGKLVVPAGSNRDGNGGNKVVEALDSGVTEHQGTGSG